MPARLISIMAIVMLGACRPAKDHGDREVSVAAAADLKFALDEVAAAFENQNRGIQVRVAYGSSGNFYSQLVNQAPFDLFVSADLEYPRKLARQGLTMPGAEFIYAIGRIAVWVPEGSPIDVEKLEMNAFSHPSVMHVAIANPEHAPYGRAAVSALRSAGIYESVKQKLVFGENVAQTLRSEEHTSELQSR